MMLGAPRSFHPLDRTRLWLGVSALCIGILVALAPRVEAAEPGLRVTHIANAGFLIEGPGAKVIVDGLFDLGVRGYEKIPSSMRSSLEGALPPFDDVDLILATHHHADHFGPKAVAAHLQANPKALFVSTPVAIRELGDFLAPGSELLERVRSVLPADGKREILELESMSLEILFLHHGDERRESAPNLGFLGHMGGLNWLHIGDTEAARKDFRAYALQQEALDLAFLPGWFLAESRWSSVTNKEIPTRQIIAMHLPEPDAPPSYFGSARTLEGRIERIHRRFPEAIVLDRGESVVFDPP